MNTSLTSLLIYAKDMQRAACFYAENFGFATNYEVVDGLIELAADDDSAGILIHQAAKSLKFGSAVLKLSFSVTDVDQFVATATAGGLKLGTIHRGNGYAFANTKEPDGNSISVSSRKYRA